METLYGAVKRDLPKCSGADGTSLHGFCEEWITELITSMRNESYQPQPNRITMIPKSNGKMHKLSFPNGKDKLVQEAVRIILECIYEPTFSTFSHGFRPKRSTQSAIAEVETRRGTIWFIEGDISACFDEINHRTLETILRERFSDDCHAGYQPTSDTPMRTLLCQGRSRQVSAQSIETTITHLEYGETYAVKVACTVREGTGYFANPPISCI